MTKSTYAQLIQGNVSARELLIALLTGKDPISGDALGFGGGAVSTYDALKLANITEQQLLAALVAAQDPITGATIAGLGGGAAGAAGAGDSGMAFGQWVYSPTATAQRTGTCADIVIQGGTVGLKDATGEGAQCSTGASNSVSAGINGAQSESRIGWGTGFVSRFRISSVTDGSSFVGLSQAGFIGGQAMAGAKAVGMAYDKALGHANWQWVTDNGSRVYTDSGVALAANTDIVTEFDCADLANPTMKIKDVSGTVLASHNFTAAASPLATQNLDIMVLITAPASGTVINRTINVYRVNAWRRR